MFTVAELALEWSRIQHQAWHVLSSLEYYKRITEQSAGLIGLDSLRAVLLGHCWTLGTISLGIASSTTARTVAYIHNINSTALLTSVNPPPTTRFTTRTLHIAGPQHSCITTGYTQIGVGGLLN